MDFGFLDLEIYVNGIEGERVAEWDELVGDLGCLDGGDAGDGEDVAFGEGFVAECCDGFRSAGDLAGGGGGAELDGLVADIDHAGGAFGV